MIYMNSISFSHKETEKIKEILEIYHFLKEIILYSEKLDIEAYLNVINELRNAYDHIIRVLEYKLDNYNDEEYIIGNLNKSLGHVFRATYDCLDVTSLVLISNIKDELEYSDEPIDDYQNIAPKILEYEGDLVRLRATKDIANINSNALFEYKDLIKDLVNIKDSLSRRK